MKKIVLVICMAVLGAVLPSCSRTADIDKRVDDATMRTLTINLNEIDLSSQLNAMRNSVSFEDVQKYVSRTSPQTKGGEKDYEIIPQVDGENDTIFYLVQYEKGWKLIASDKRVQPILAESQNGLFNTEVAENGPAIWLDILAAEMKNVKNTLDEEMTIPKEEQEAYKKLWLTFSDMESVLLSQNVQTKGGSRGPGGHYEYVTTYMEWEDYDLIGHMTYVKMHQYKGLNNYLPLKSNSNVYRAPTGCVALAGTIMLCFLHDSIGVPAAIPSSATVSGNITDYSMWQGNFSTSIWSLFSPLDDYAAAAPLAAFVAEAIQTIYGDSDSIAENVELKNTLFPIFGITCSRGNYNASTVASSLVSGMPVIVSAKRDVEYIYGIPHYIHGHSFIIDAYKRHRLKYTEVYQWVYDDPGMHPEPDEPFHYVIYYNSPEISYVKMNWCDNGNEEVDAWYTLTENWPVVVNNQTYYYAYERKMTYNFEED